MSLSRSATLRMGSTILILSLVLLFFVFWDKDAFFEWKQNAGALPFFSALAILPALGVPTTPFFLLAGATFGLRTALIGSALAIAINLGLCYVLAQTFLRHLLIMSLAKFDYRIPELSPEQAIKFILAVKLTPGPPTFLKNYITALAGAPFPQYIVICSSITFAYAAAFIVLGESFLDRDWSQGIWALVLLVLLVVALWYLRRRVTQGRQDDTSTEARK